MKDARLIVAVLLVVKELKEKWTLESKDKVLAGEKGFKKGGAEEEQLKRAVTFLALHNGNDIVREILEFV